jgi:hypothetical protein
MKHLLLNELKTNGYKICDRRRTLLSTIYKSKDAAHTVAIASNNKLKRIIKYFYNCISLCSDGLLITLAE